MRVEVWNVGKKRQIIAEVTNDEDKILNRVLRLYRAIYETEY